jgi:hypothetical protein
VYNTMRETTLCVWLHVIFSVHLPTSGFCVLSHIPMVWRHVKVVRQRTSPATSRHSFITTVWVMRLVHTTDKTWYTVLYHHNMYVISLSKISIKTNFKQIARVELKCVQYSEETTFFVWRHVIFSVHSPT